MMMTKEIRDDQSGQTDFDLDGIERALARKNIPIVLGTELVIAKATILTDTQPVKTDAYTRLTTIVSRLNKAMEGKYSTAITDEYHEEIKKIKPEK